MCRMRAWSCWDGDCTACQKLLHFPHSVLLPSLVVAPLLLSFWTLHPQSLWWRRGGRCYYCCSSYYLFHYKYHPLLLSEPLDHLMTKTFVGWFSRTAILCGDWLSLYAPAPSLSLTYDPSSPWYSSLMFLYRPEHHTYSNTLVVYCWDQLFPKPVLHIRFDRFRLSLSGCFNYICVFVWRNLLQLAPSSHQNSFFSNYWIADLGMLSALGMLNLGMLDAGFGMLSAFGMQDLVCCLHLVCRIFLYIFASVLL